MPGRCSARFQSAICAILTKPIAHARLDQPRFGYHSRATLQFPIGFESDIVLLWLSIGWRSTSSWFTTIVMIYVLFVKIVVMLTMFTTSLCLHCMSTLIHTRKRSQASSSYRASDRFYVAKYFLFYIVNLDKCLWIHQIPHVASQTL